MYNLFTVVEVLKNVSVKLNVYRINVNFGGYFTTPNAS